MKTQTKKTFDSVKMMRDIRDKIDRKLEGKSSDEILKYYEERRKAIEKWKRKQETINKLPVRTFNCNLKKMTLLTRSF